MGIRITDEPWRGSALFWLIPRLPGHAVEGVQRTKEIPRENKVEVFDLGWCMYECVAEVHLAADDHGDHRDCSWMPLMDRQGHPWLFTSMGQVETAIERIVRDRQSKGREPSD